MLPQRIVLLEKRLRTASRPEDWKIRNCSWHAQRRRCSADCAYGRGQREDGLGREERASKHFTTGVFAHTVPKLRSAGQGEGIRPWELAESRDELPRLRWEFRGAAQTPRSALQPYVVTSKFA
jgi:hypothetical protein